MSESDSSQAADIIVATPLAVRLSVGEHGSGADCLSSIEIAVVLQLEDLIMQNWEHLLTTMSATNQTPSNDHGADFSRVRTFCLNGWGRHYRCVQRFFQKKMTH
jgi:U3 small nucleolar RNA-associated protein 25